MAEDIRLQQCCVEAANEVYAARYPKEPCIRDDWLRTHLLSIANKWGRVASTFAKSVFVRSVPLRSFFDARTFTIQCPNGHRADVVLLGSRVYYLAWRVNLICATYLSQSLPQSDRMVLSGGNREQWPMPLHVAQLRTALRVYMEDDCLSNDGFGDLKEFAAGVATATAINQEYIGDFSLLFLMLHEIQHSMRMDQLPKGSLSYRVEAGVKGLSEVRARRWSAELSHDANAALVLIVSATEVLKKIHGLTSDDAKTQAAGLVFPGVDLALHILQLVEQRRFGLVTPEEAAITREFASHPPSEYRRRSMSHVAYTFVTNKPLTAMFEGHAPENWRFVAGNTAAQMSLRERLFGALNETGT